jgi:hypothetical protein
LDDPATYSTLPTTARSACVVACCSIEARAVRSAPTARARRTHSSEVIGASGIGRNFSANLRAAVAGRCSSVMAPNSCQCGSPSASAPPFPVGSSNTMHCSMCSCLATSEVAGSIARSNHVLAEVVAGCGAPSPSLS